MIQKNENFKEEHLNRFLKEYTKYLRYNSNANLELSLMGKGGDFLFYCYALYFDTEEINIMHINKLVIEIFHYIAGNKNATVESYWNDVFGIILMFELLDKEEFIDTQICRTFFEFDEKLLDYLSRQNHLNDRTLYAANTLLFRLRHYEPNHVGYFNAEIVLIHIVEIILRGDISLHNSVLLITNQIAFLIKILQRGVYVEPIMTYLNKLATKFQSISPTIESISIMLVYHDYLSHIKNEKELQAMIASILSTDYFTISFNNSSSVFADSLTYFVFLNRLIHFYHSYPSDSLKTFISDRLVSDINKMKSSMNNCSLQNGIIQAALPLTAISFLNPDLSNWDTLFLIS